MPVLISNCTLRDYYFSYLHISMRMQYPLQSVSRKVLDPKETTPEVQSRRQQREEKGNEIKDKWRKDDTVTNS